ncbi:MAG: ABC transporter ATP-binding protein, partial [Desulfobacterales bacterium]
MNEIIRFESVSYTYPFQAHKALDGISFAVRAGEAVLCTGASGCGKSTLVRMINGLIPHYFHGNMQGRVWVCRARTTTCRIHEISRHVGTLFQEPEQQFFALSVADEMAFALECRAMAPEQIKAKIRAEAERFRLTHLMAASVFDLSEGEKQKVALASILAQSPSVLVLDEPSANLDPAATEELAGILADLKQQGMTLFIVDHRLYWLNDLVDRVIVLENGRICETGPFSILEKRTVRNRYGLRKTHFRRAPDALISAGQTDGEGFRIENLSFAFKNRTPVFESATAFLPKGSVIAVTGANGAGKTTFARLLTGLLRPRSGEIHYNNRPALPKELLKHGSIVLQNADHQLHMKTAGQELALAARHLAKAARRQRVK